jgi:hypothetical protein
MPRYDRVYARLAKRAVKQGAIDLETFIEQMLDAGTSLIRTEQLLLEDLENNGPIFGKFIRSLSGAAESSISAAGNQGELAGHAITDKELRRQLTIADSGEYFRAVHDEADPDVLQAIEDELADDVKLTWIATFANTCHLCLPLHGTAMTLREWMDRGLHPDTIHSQQGWVSSCYCRLEPQEFAEREDLKAPLARTKQGNKRTMRAVAQKDIDKAIAARDKAMESIEGRRTLRALGTVLEG